MRRWRATLLPDRPTLRAQAYGLLRTILNSANADDLLPVNPCRIRGAGSTTWARVIRPATLTELTSIAQAMPARLRLLVLLAAWCALRFGEATELRRADLDHDTGLLRVRRGVVRVQGQEIVGRPKSEAGIRDIAIPHAFSVALK